MSEKKQKEPMIGDQNRPSPIDFDAPITDLTMRDLVSVFHGQFVEKEQVKEYSKEWMKVERIKEWHTKEFKELTFKEVLKGDIIKEFKGPELKPEKEVGGIDQTTIEQIAERVADVLERRGRG